MRLVGARSTLRSFRGRPTQQQALRSDRREMDRCLRLVAHTVDLDDDAFAPLAVADIVATLSPIDSAPEGSVLAAAIADSTTSSEWESRPPPGAACRNLAAATAAVGATATAAITSRAQHAGAADLVDQLGRNLVEETTRRVVLSLADHPAAPRTGEMELLHRPSDADIGRRRSSSSSDGSPNARTWGNTPSSMPTRNTTGNSRPLAA